MINKKLLEEINKTGIEYYYLNEKLHDLKDRLIIDINTTFSTTGNITVFDDNISYRVRRQRTEILNIKNIFEPIKVRLLRISCLSGARTGRQKAAIENALFRFDSNFFTESKSSTKLWYFEECITYIDFLNKYKTCNFRIL